MTTKAQRQLSDPWWRLNNLYYIKNKKGKKVKFKPNWAQKFLYENMHYLSIILKARQLGMTTFIQLFMLDRALFNDNVNCGVVAHNKEDAEVFFADKIKFAYDNLPKDLLALRKATSNTARSLHFPNGSRFYVGTSLRSGTYQYVHISEFGKMCAKYPDKAAEVITGTLNTIEPGQIAFIESTAEGPFGEFYDMCKASQLLTEAADAGKTRLTEMDWRFYFFPWYKHPDYRLNAKVDIPPKMEVYFRKLREEEGIELTYPMKAWYVKKAAEQGDKMKQEYPSTPAEAFERSTEVSIYGKQLRQARRDGRIGKVPIIRGLPVNTFWDLGRNDVTAIWFHQFVEGRHHFINYEEDRLQNLAYYVDLLIELKKEYGWFYGNHYLPHDVEVTDISSLLNESRRQILERAGLKPIIVVPRIKSVNDGIEMTRKKFDECWFDEENCKQGLKALDGYEWSWDELHRTLRKTPVHNWASNGADAFRQFPQGYRSSDRGWAKQAEAANANTGGGRAYARGNGKRGTLTNPSLDHIL